MENINKKIIDIKYKMLKREQMLRHKRDLQERLEIEQGALKRLQNELVKEEADVSRLEGISIGALLQSINGGKGLRLEKEKADAARAALDYKQKQSDVEYLQYELNLLTTQLKDYDHLEGDLEEYIDLKKKMIPADIRKQIIHMEEELSTLHIKNQEIKEAREIGEKASSSLNAIIEHMNAYMVDATDPLFVYPEHEELTDMAKELVVFKELWKQFEKEVNDTGLAFELHEEEVLMNSISDYIYTQEEDEKVITENVHKSYNQLTALYGTIRNARQSLKTEYEKNAYRIDELNIEIKKVIEEN